ncbi:hypothetical protein GQ457_15G016500 [Hibiscus cannabinus]
MRRSNFPDLTSSSEMRRSNEFKSYFTTRRAEESDKLQIPSNRQKDEKIKTNSDLASSSEMRRSNFSDLASSSGMRRDEKVKQIRILLVRDEKIKPFRSYFLVRGAKGQILLQIQSIRQWNGGSNSTSDPIYPSVEWWIKPLFQIMPLRQGRA